MKKTFENVVLAEFTANSGDVLFTYLKEENNKGHRERLLEAFFNGSIAPLFDGTDTELNNANSKRRAIFAASVIDELYRCIIEPNLIQGRETPGASFAVSLMAIFIARHTDQEPFVCACRAVRLENFAPLCKPSLRPDRVRTFAEELELQDHLEKLDRWGTVFSKLHKTICKH